MQLALPRTWFALVLAGLASSCASVPKADKLADAEAKRFAARPDKCGLYVYRDEWMGSAIRMQVDLDGKPLGSTAPKTFLFAWLDPGDHTLVSHAEHDSQLVIEAKAGTLVYIWQEVKMGLWSANSMLHVRSEDAGQKGVRECELAETAH